MRAWLVVLVWLSIALPAQAHLQVRGTPLSELAARSSGIVIGVVEAVARSGEEFAAEQQAGNPAVDAPVNGTADRRVRLRVEHWLVGPGTGDGASAAPERFEFACDTHHAPDYAAGERVLVFLQESRPPFSSRQTEPDRLLLPDDPAERGALLEAVQRWSALRTASTIEARLPRLRQAGLELLDSASPRVRREALIDLITVAPRGGFETEQVASLVARAKQAAHGVGQAAGLVTLLAALPAGEAVPALESLLAGATSARVRLLAGRALQERRAPSSVPLLAAALDDPDLGVRLTAERALEAFGSEASRRVLAEHGPVAKPVIASPDEAAAPIASRAREAAARESNLP